MRTKLILSSVVLFSIVGVAACSATQEIATDPGGGSTTTTAASSALGNPPPDPDSVVSSPPMDPGETTIPMATTSARPAAGQGVLQGWATGGLDCAPDEACPAIAMIISGTVTATAADGSATTATIDATGGWGMALAPGEYVVTVQADQGRCDEVSATVTAGAATEVGLTCLVPR